MAYLKAMNRRFRGWWKHSIKKLRGKRKPSKVTNVTKEFKMAKNVTVAWVLPLTRQGGGPLPLSEIAHTQVELSADGGDNFGLLVQVPPNGIQQAFVPDLEIGQWIFRITVVDTDGRSGTPYLEDVTVADDTPPNGVTDVTVTQE